MPGVEASVTPDEVDVLGAGDGVWWEGCVSSNQLGKLREYQCYYSESRTHSGQNGENTVESVFASVHALSHERD
jgi:hypothetical protein